ncbi:MAG: c-type cytochrome [Limisphaerales bacterium]
MKKLLLIACVGLVATSFLGCRSARRSEPTLGKFPEANRQFESGRMVFMRHCHECHPNGEGGLGPALNDKPLPRFLVKTQVRTGLGVMPAFSTEQITPAELDDLVDYMVALRRTGPRR